VIIEDFDIKTDLKVEFFMPDASGTTFILGISELGGTDVLGGKLAFTLGSSLLGGVDLLGETGTRTGFIWQAAQAAVTNFQGSVGGSIESTYYFQPETGFASIQLQSFDWDPGVNKNIRTNTPVRLRIDNGLVNHTIFTGYIDTINVNYYPDGLNVIQITAYDIYKQIVNTRVDTYDTTSFGSYVTPLQAVTKLLSVAGFELSTDSVATDGKLPTGVQTNITANTVLNDALQVGLGVLWVNQETEQLIFTPRPTASTSATWTIGNNHGEANHLCLSDIQVSADADTIFNSLTVTLASNDTISTTQYDADSVELYGESSADVTLNTTDLTELNRWAAAVFAQTPNKLVKEVETPSIDRLGNLTEASVFTPGIRIGVKFDREQLSINEFYTITKVSHEITPNTWFTKFELWKAA